MSSGAETKWPRCSVLLPRALPRRHIFEKLEGYAPGKLDAWYKLFKIGDLSYYAILAG